MPQDIINTESVHESDRQRATVADRGSLFGDVYLFNRSGEVEVRFLWTGVGRISVAGGYAATESQKKRAVRALAETAFGRAALGLEEWDPTSVPSADEEELLELRAAAEAAGLTLSSAPVEPSAPAPAPAGDAATTMSTMLDGVKVEVRISREN